MNIKLIIAMHKPYKTPADDLYFPLHVGHSCMKGFGVPGDDTGEHISEKNDSYCELTGLYWAWKNLNCDYLGLVHYRRYFTRRSWWRLMRCRTLEQKLDSVLTRPEAEKLCEIYDIILPKKRRYYIESIYTHYAHTHYGEHLDLVRDILSRSCPEYLESFDRIMSAASCHMFNMFLMKKSIADEYCEWLFPILSQLEERIPCMELSFFQGRICGRVGEILLNVWLDKESREQNFRIKEIRCIHMEKVDWPKKILRFLRAKYFHEKYERN